MFYSVIVEMKFSIYELMESYVVFVNTSLKNLVSVPSKIYREREGKGREKSTLAPIGPSPPHLYPIQRI